jgi:hypothetical protein
MREPHVYGRWAGNPQGIKEDRARCVEGIWASRTYRSYQCERKRGHGLDGEYCKQHAKKHPDRLK